VVAEHLEIYRNGTLAYEYDKRAGLERMQFAYVQRMDADMDRGIHLNGEYIRSPGQAERNQFVIGQLVKALGINDSRSIAMLCRYLAQRIPELDIIRVEEGRDNYSVDLVYGKTE
jgi:hypothetical protein